jgi:hypothetical protein
MYVVECCFSLLMLQEEEEEYGTEYLVQPVGQPEDEDEGASDFEPVSLKRKWSREDNEEKDKQRLKR